MAGSERGERPSVIKRLQNEPWQFEFFQAVRLLELAERPGAPGKQRKAVGTGASVLDEAVRFRVPATRGFPGAEIVRLSQASSVADDETDVAPPEMHVSFFGMVGPAGVLPTHYTQLIIDRERRYKDSTLRLFLDLFHHRQISLFYRAWEKYRLPVLYQRAKRQGPETDDPVSSDLYCLVGLGSSRLRGRLGFSDETFLYYAAHFARWPRTALVLETLVRDLFEVPAKLLQFQGQWLHLSPADQTRMPTKTDPRGSNNQMGQSVLIGSRVWSAESKFRLRIGPVGYADLHRFSPGGDRLKPLCQFVRMYVGRDLDFDVQVVLKGDETPPSKLGADAAAPSRMGWNTWLISRAPERDQDDAVYRDEGLPER